MRRNSKLEGILILASQIIKSRHFYTKIKNARLNLNLKIGIIKLKNILMSHGKVGSKFFFSPLEITTLLRNLSFLEILGKKRGHQKFLIPIKVFLALKESDLKTFCTLSKIKFHYNSIFMARIVHLEGFVLSVSNVFIKEKSEMSFRSDQTRSYFQNQYNFTNVIISEEKKESEYPSSKDEYQEAILMISEGRNQNSFSNSISRVKLKIYSNLINKIGVGKKIRVWGIMYISLSLNLKLIEKGQVLPEVKVIQVKKGNKKFHENLKIAEIFPPATIFHDNKIRGWEIYFRSGTILQWLRSYYPFYNIGIILFFSFSGGWLKKNRLSGKNRFNFIFLVQQKVRFRLILKKLLKFFPKKISRNKISKINGLFNQTNNEMGDHIVNNSTAFSKLNKSERVSFLTQKNLEEDINLQIMGSRNIEIKNFIGFDSNSFFPFFFIIKSKTTEKNQQFVSKTGIKEKIINNSPIVEHLKLYWEIDYFFTEFFFPKFNNITTLSDWIIDFSGKKKPRKTFFEKYQEYKHNSFIHLDVKNYVTYIGNFRHPRFSDGATNILNRIYFLFAKINNSKLRKITMMEKIIKLSVSHSKFSYHDFVLNYDCLYSYIQNIIYYKYLIYLEDYYNNYREIGKNLKQICKYCQSWIKKLNNLHRITRYPFSQTGISSISFI